MNKILSKLNFIGFDFKEVVEIGEGANRTVYNLSLSNGSEAIAKTRSKQLNQKDTLFNGFVSNKREKNILSILHNNYIPVPKVYFCDDELIVTEKLKGTLFSQFLENNNHSEKLFLKSMFDLGVNIGKVQKIKFNNYGDIIGKNRVYQKGLTNFKQRINNIFNYRLHKALTKKVITDAEYKTVTSLFKKKIEKVFGESSIKSISPVFVLTDLHVDNFIVNDEGFIAGFFDIESSQSAHPALEFYGIKMFLMNYYDEYTFKKAKSSFENGYISINKDYDFSNKENIELEKILTAGRMLELAESYCNINDGIRNSWSSKFKELLLDYIHTNNIDYQAISSILRYKTKQPKKAIDSTSVSILASAITYKTEFKEDK